MGSNKWITVWSGESEIPLDAKGFQAPLAQIFNPTSCMVPQKVDAVHVEMATWKSYGLKEIDTVTLSGINKLEPGIVTDSLKRVVYVPSPYKRGPDTFSVRDQHHSLVFLFTDIYTQYIVLWNRLPWRYFTSFSK